jgi:hypothetical protein
MKQGEVCPEQPAKSRSQLPVQELCICTTTIKTAKKVPEAISSGAGRFLKAGGELVFMYNQGIKCTALTKRCAIDDYPMRSVPQVGVARILNPVLDR